jgi:non-heme chloroperoxidase
MNLANSFPQYFFTRDKTRIFYTTNFDNRESLTSSKPLMVFNYGLVCNVNHWKDQISFLDSLGYPILLHDYRSHYGSSGSENLDDVNFVQMTDDVMEIIQSLAPSNVIMLGHSMGVNVTLEFARRFPEVIDGAVLISGTVLPPQDIMFDSNITDIIFPFLQFFSKKYPKVFKKIWDTSYMNPLARNIVYKGGFNTSQVSEEFIELYMKKISELPQDILLHLLLEMKNHDILNDLDKIHTPCLIMGGDLDKVIPNYLQTILHDRLPSSQMYIIKEGSHVPQVDFPESVNERILLFIRDLNLARSA